LSFSRDQRPGVDAEACPSRGKTSAFFDCVETLPLCDKVFPVGSVARAIRNVRFDNE
jgi:hypothetical protein